MNHMFESGGKVYGVYKGGYGLLTSFHWPGVSSPCSFGLWCGTEGIPRRHRLLFGLITDYEDGFVHYIVLNFL